MSALAVGADVPGPAAVPSRTSNRFRLRTDRGDVLPLHVGRWFGEPEPVEEEVLARALSPVLDVGCGPARHSLALKRRGAAALGVDVAPSAVRIAEDRGVPVMHRSVFDPLPLEGQWGSALLFDGNVGIGGDPAALLGRIRALVRAGGRALVEVDPPGVPTQRLHVAIEIDGEKGPWFAWARVGADAVCCLAERTGFAMVELWTGEGRWFARLDAR
jgi:SAM-dependent methyltransferase